MRWGGGGGEGKGKGGGTIDSASRAEREETLVVLRSKLPARLSRLKMLVFNTSPRVNELT